MMLQTGQSLRENHAVLEVRQRESDLPHLTPHADPVEVDVRRQGGMETKVVKPKYQK